MQAYHEKCHQHDPGCHSIFWPCQSNITSTFVNLFILRTIRPLPLCRHFYIFSLGHHSLFFLDGNVCYLIELSSQVVPYLCHTTANWLTLGRSELLFDPEVKYGLGQVCQPRDISISVSPISPSSGVQYGDQSWELSSPFLSPRATSPPVPSTDITVLTYQVSLCLKVSPSSPQDMVDNIHIN